MFKKKILTIADMIALEQKAKQNDLVKIINNEQALNMLSLQLEVVNPENDNSWDADTEAILMPSTDGRSNGTIKIQKKYENNKFSYAHEIVHYLIDVGKGKKVGKTYTRKIAGKTPDLHEQKINYLTAAAIIPIEDIRVVLKDYDKSSPKKDEVKIVSDLCEKYQQEKKVILRRIQEVRQIDAYLSL